MKFARELQIQIDDVYACPGNCAGCILVADERRTRTPDMSERLLRLSIDRLSDYIPTLDHLEYINLTYGIGDHLRMDQDYLKLLHELGADLLERHGFDAPKNAVFFTTSLIGKADILMPRLEELARHQRRVQFYPIAVLDPAKLYSKNFGAVYEGNILRTKELFGKVDLAINLSAEAIERITPQDLHDFAAENEFDEVTINWTPTKANKEFTAPCIDDLAGWLIDFNRAVIAGDKIGSSFAPVLRRSIDAVMCGADGDTMPTLQQAVNDVLPETIRKSIEIDHLGNLLPKLEAVGDITHGERFGLPTLGNINQAPIQELLGDAMAPLKARVIGIHSRSAACASCDNLAICSVTGFHVATHILGPRADRTTGCPHVAAQLIDHFKQEAVAADELRQNAEFIAPTTAHAPSGTPMVAAE
ncbi:MAG: hypothetical protein AAF213_02330 [Pseudomonadota bacterium]